MKHRLMDIICCPACAGRLELDAILVADDPDAPSVAGQMCRTFCHARHEPLAANGAAPDCTACLKTSIMEGVLFCPACTLTFPVIDGVPRLVRNACDEYREFFAQHAERIDRLRGHDSVVRALERLDARTYHPRSNASFTHQWREHGDTDRTWFKDDLALRPGEFLEGLAVTPAELSGRLVLDAGCGNGKLTTAIAGYGAEVVGMDLSRSVEGAQARRRAIAGSRAPFVHFVQGNIMEPPFAKGAFDHIHTSGVLHHTPSTRRAFSKFLTLAAPGARVYVQLYRKREAWVGIPNRLIRMVTSRLPVPLLYRLCYAAVPAHTAAVRAVAWLRREPTAIHQASRRERAVSMFDNYSPRYQHRYTPSQVRRMFETAGLSSVRDVTLENERRHMVAFVGRRPEPS
jgi:SAM-dependent methyltransferase